jgi:hypothetical protein
MVGEVDSTGLGLIGIGERGEGGEDNRGIGIGGRGEGVRILDWVRGEGRGSVSK